MTEATALGFQERVEALIEAVRADGPPDSSTATWVTRLSDAHHAKLARVGLVVPRDGAADALGPPLLGSFLGDFVAKREKLLAAGKNKPGTVATLKVVRDNLVDFFGATCPMDRITAGRCDEWRDWLGTEKKLADNTIRRRCGIGRQYFRAAVRLRLLTENPFQDMRDCSVGENRARDYFVCREEAAKVLEACPDAQWRLLFALSRFGGLRCPSEHLGLRWADVDWDRRRFTVHSPKTARKGKPSRLVPLFPELRPYLEAVYFAYLEAGEVPEHVITRYRDTNANLRTQLIRIIGRAGLQPWPKLFQNLRATRATELVSQGWPEYKVCAWLGHTEAVAKRHYWQVTDADYQRAAGVDSSDPAALQMALQVSGATPCKGVNADFGAPDGTPDATPSCSKSHPAADYFTTEQVRLAGFEPAAYGLGNRCSIP